MHTLPSSHIPIPLLLLQRYCTRSTPLYLSVTTKHSTLTVTLILTLTLTLTLALALTLTLFLLRPPYP